MWTLGRQGTGYLKAPLARCRFFELWLIKYPSGTCIPQHLDPVEGKRHLRLNVTLIGEQTYVGDALFRLGPIVLFRPDIMAHETRRSARVRYVLSLSWALRTYGVTS